MKLSMTSPNGRLRCRLIHEPETGGLFYAFTRDTFRLLGLSNLGVSLAGKTTFFRNVELLAQESIARQWSPLWGQYSIIHDRHNAYTFGCDGDSNMNIEFKLFDEGLAFRYVCSGGEISDDLTTFNVGEDRLCSFTCGERAPAPSKLLSECDFEVEAPSNLPLVVRSDNGPALAILESAPIDFSQMRIAKDPVSPYTLKASIHSSRLDQHTKFPWRIILVADNPGDFLTSTLALNLAEPSALSETSWIQPGKSLWDWRVHGAGYDGFTYGIHTEAMKRLIDFSSENGYRYFLADAAWCKENEGKPLESSDAVDMAEVIAHGQRKHVGVILYYDLKYMNQGVPELDFDLAAKTFSDMGAVGIKYGFLGIVGSKLVGQAKSRKTMHIIRTCAKYQLLVDFHDNPIPMPGLERTWPHVITREFCHAQQDRRTGFDSNEFIRLAYVNHIMGPMDQANGIYAITDCVNRDRGARNGVASTVAAETARMGLIHSGLITLPDAPEEYRTRSDIFAIIKEAPASWDESRFLEGRFDEYMVMARRSGNIWYIFGANNDTERTVNIPVSSFVHSGAIRARIGEDSEDSHFRDNPESYHVRTEKYSPDQIIKIRMAPGGGFCVCLDTQHC